MRSPTGRFLNKKDITLLLYNNLFLYCEFVQCFISEEKLLYLWEPEFKIKVN